MNDTITIAGESFTVPVRYKEGDTLSANEARALNQTYHENLRNNFAKQVKDAKEAGAFDAADLQASLDEYAQTYEFGQSGGGGRSGDPVEAEAMAIARQTIKDALRKNGKQLKDYNSKQISEAARKWLDKNRESVMAEAKARVEKTRSIAGEGLDEVLSGLAA